MILQRSQKFILFAVGLFFLAHCFGSVTNTVIFNYGYGPTTSRAELSPWSVHPWYLFVPLMAVTAYAFYTRSPRIGWYWAVAIAGLLLNAPLGMLGLAGAVSAFYALYLKRQEEKAAATRPRAEGKRL